MEDFLVHPGKAFRNVKAKVCFNFEVVFDFDQLKIVDSKIINQMIRALKSRN